MISWQSKASELKEKVSDFDGDVVLKEVKVL